MAEWTGSEYLADPSNSGTSKYDRETNFYLWGYGAIMWLSGLFNLTFAWVAAYTMVAAAGRMHLRLLANLIRSPMAFFYTTPIGRIVNRFSNDVEILDFTLPHDYQFVLTAAATLIATFIMIVWSAEELSIALFIVGVLYVLMMLVYLPTSRQLRRVDSITRSPVYAHFSETLNGAACIRAYGVKDKFIEESENRINRHLKYYFPNIVVYNWMHLCTATLGSLVIFAGSLTATTSPDMDEGIVGILISTAPLQMTTAMHLFVEFYSQFEIHIVAVERIKEYCSTPQEAAWINSDYRPSHGWPEHGEIQFESYNTRYRPGLDLVLKDVTFNVKPGEKIGIVGRTGAGKSSLTSALFRIMEAAEGSIVIDGVPIAQIGLHDLRRRIAILPQDPVVFSGSLRQNIDPLEEHSDRQVWAALERAHLKPFVEGLPGGLSHQCEEMGANLSVGQRQLVCLARALLRKTSILVLDEATAAVDFETDELIQETIRTQFSDCTILSIAHRLKTIMDYDRVMVLDKGVIKEMDTPSALLENQQSIFHGIVSASGLKRNK